MKDQILTWFAMGRVGLSSKAMAVCMAGLDPKDKSHPHDPDDFNRCLLFLDSVPEARGHLDKLRNFSPEWDSLVDHWAEIEVEFLREAGLDWCHGKRAPKTYAIMAEVLGRTVAHDRSAWEDGGS